MAQLQEEMAADFMKSRFIFALQQDGKGTPLVKLNTGDKYQLVFTDAVEFSRFNRNKAFKPVIVDAAQLPKVLDREAKGVVLNIMGVNLPLAVNRPAPAPAGSRQQEHRQPQTRLLQPQHPQLFSGRQQKRKTAKKHKVCFFTKNVRKPSGACA